MSGSREQDTTASDIFAVTGSGSLRAITSDGRSFSPSLDRSDSTLTFTKSVGGTVADTAAPASELWMASSDGGNPRRLVYGAGITEQQLSPDGSHVVLTSEIEPSRSPTSGRGTSSAEPSNGDTPSAAQTPSATPQSTGPTMTPGSGFQAWMVDVATEASSPLIEPIASLSRQGYLAWNADGRYVALTEITEQAGAGPALLRVIDATSHTEVARVLAPSGTAVSDLTWSDDSTAIYGLGTDTNGVMNVLQFNVTGASPNVQKLETVPADAFAAFTAGSKLPLLVTMGTNGFAIASLAKGVLIPTELRSIGTPSPTQCLRLAVR